MVRKALFWTFISQFAIFIVNFAGSVFIARLLTPHDMGVYAIATATIGILQLLTSFGVGLFAVREENLTPQMMDAAFTMNVLLSGVFGLFLVAFSFVGARFLGEPGVASVLQVLALTPVITALGFTPGVMLQRAMLFRGTSIIGAAAALITMAVTLGAALAGAKYMSPAYGAVASAIFSTAAIIIIGREHFALRLSTKDWPRMLAFGLRIMSINGVSSAAVRVSDVVLGNMLGLAALGLYSRATNITNLLFQNVYGTMTRVVFAKLSQTQRENGDIAQVYLRGLRMVAGIMGPVLIGLAVLSGPIVRLLYGERWLGAAMPLSLLLIGQFISLGFAMNWELFVVRDRLQTQTRLEIGRSVLGIVTQIIGCLFSLVVVAATSIVDNFISLIVYGRYMPELARTTGARLRRIYAEAILLTTVAVMPAFIFMTFSGWHDQASIAVLAAMIASGALAWLAVIFKIKHPLAEELRLILKKLRTRLRFAGAARAN